MIKLITATLQTGTLSQPSSHQGECPQALAFLPPPIHFLLQCLSFFQSNWGGHGKF
jgi:hypothetical protein